MPLQFIIDPIVQSLRRVHGKNCKVVKIDSKQNNDNVQIVDLVRPTRNVCLSWRTSIKMHSTYTLFTLEIRLLYRNMIDYYTVRKIYKQMKFIMLRTIFTNELRPFNQTVSNYYILFILLGVPNVKVKAIHPTHFISRILFSSK